jgi:hypothetical protein
VPGDGLDFVEVDQPAMVGLGECAAQVACRHGCREVEQRLRHGGDRQALVARPLQVPPSVNSNICEGTSSAADAHVDSARLIAPDAQPPSGGCVAEHGARPGVQKRRGEPPLQRERSVPDRVNAAMDPLQATVIYPARNGRGGHPAPLELHPADHAPLPFAESGQGNFGDFRRRGRRNSPFVGHGRQDRGAGVTRQPAMATLPALEC